MLVVAAPFLLVRGPAFLPVLDTSLAIEWLRWRRRRRRWWRLRWERLHWAPHSLMLATPLLLRRRPTSVPILHACMAIKGETRRSRCCCPCCCHAAEAKLGATIFNLVIGPTARVRVPAIVIGCRVRIGRETHARCGRGRCGRRRR